MGKKGVSYAEKQKRMLAYFLETKRVYTLKNLEKDLPKKKGIVSQSVKDVLQSLVDEEKIDTDKIGSGNFFWAFPSKAVQKRKNVVKSLQLDMGSKKLDLDNLRKRKSQALEGRKDTDERRSKLRKYSELKQQIESVDLSLSKFAASDPKTIEEKQKAIRFCWTNGNRWVDNVFCVLSFTKKKRPDMKDAQILKFMQLPQEFDYIPDPKHAL
ncbi:hypothetical protein AAMO2058_000444800 [Amorphochlora amoebiformis]